MLERPFSREGEILPTELWRTKEPELYDPEDVNFLFIVAADDIHVVVYVYSKGLFSALRKDFIRVYERDVEEEMKSRLPLPEFKKWFSKFNATKCKHGLPIFLEGIKINRACGECFTKEPELQKQDLDYIVSGTSGTETASAIPVGDPPIA